MPKRQRRSKRRAPLNDGFVLWACDMKPPDTPETAVAFETYLDCEYFDTADEIAARWRDHGRRAIEAWVADHPGTRSKNWWRTAATAPALEGETEFQYLERLGLLLPGEASQAASL